MTALWKKTISADGASGLEAVPMGGVALDRPTVIFLTGVSTTTKQPGFVGGALSHLQEMVDSFGEKNSDKADLFAWSYEKMRSNLKSVFNYNCFPDRYYSRQARQFVDNFLIPHLADDAVYKNNRFIRGVRKDRNDVMRSFQNLTFMAYSFGSVFSQEVYNAAKSRMKKLGYSGRETRALLSHIHLVSLGAVSRPMLEKNRFTSICMVATNDVITNHKSRIWFSFREVFARYAKTLTIRRLSKRNLFISAPVQKDLWEPKPDKEGNIVMRNVRHLFPKWWIRHSHHELPHYTTDKDHNNQFAKIARFALINCMFRTRPLKGKEMIAIPAGLTGKSGESDREYAAYQKRISAALK